MSTLPVHDQQGKEIAQLELDAKVFDGKVKSGLLYQAVLGFNANQRLALAATKTRGEVSGGGRKPWKQKGTGRARVGSIRSPLWRHGGVVFGPHPRDYSYSLSQRTRLEALKSSINARLQDNGILVVEDIKLDNPKTKGLAKVLTGLKAGKNTLLLLDAIDKNMKLASNNISGLVTELARNVNAYQVLRAHKIIVNKKGFMQLAERLKKK